MKKQIYIIRAPYSSGEDVIVAFSTLKGAFDYVAGNLRVKCKIEGGSKVAYRGVQRTVKAHGRVSFSDADESPINAFTSPYYTIERRLLCSRADEVPRTDSQKFDAQLGGL